MEKKAKKDKRKGIRRSDTVRKAVFSPREKRALLYLLPVLAVVSWIIYEAAKPRFDDSLIRDADFASTGTSDPQASGSTATGNAADDETDGTGESRSLFPFDPNTVEYHDLCRLGFSRGEALGIVKYRERGKIFEIPEDFASCYQVSEDMYLRLLPYIQIGVKYRLKTFGRQTDYERERDSGRGELIGDGELKSFSLDTITAAGLRTLGFSARQAEAILNYRDMKGGLRSAAEFAECYVVSGEMFGRLEPYLVFPEPESRSIPAPVDINRADSATLRGIAGIGEKTVTSIIEYRDRLGGFVSKDQLAEIRGVTEQNYERICKQIFVDSCDIRKIDVNFASAKELGKHPYVTPEALRKLLKNRQLKGGWSTAGELVEDKIFTPEEARKLVPYLLFSETGQ